MDSKERANKSKERSIFKCDFCLIFLVVKISSASCTYIYSTPLITRQGGPERKIVELSRIIKDTPYAFKTYLQTYDNTVKKFVPLELFEDQIQLIKDYEIPDIFYDEPKAIIQNKEAFEWLKAFNNEANISYSMSFTFGLKEKQSDAWDSIWIVLLFDAETNIIGHFYYAP